MEILPGVSLSSHFESVVSFDYKMGIALLEYMYRIYVYNLQQFIYRDAIIEGRRVKEGNNSYSYT